MYFQNSNFLLTKEGNVQEGTKIAHIPKIIALKFLTRVPNLRSQTPDGKTQALRMLFSLETVKLEDLCYLGLYFCFPGTMEKCAGLGMRRSSPNANCY